MYACGESFLAESAAMGWVSSSHPGPFSCCPFLPKRSCFYYGESSIVCLVDFKWLVVCETVSQETGGWLCTEKYVMAAVRLQHISSHRLLFGIRQLLWRWWEDLQA